MKAGLWLVCLCASLAACVSAAPERLPANTYVEADTGFHLRWPATFVPEARSSAAYLLPTNWRLDLRPNEPGRLLAGWVLQGSNQVLSARLRYGVSGNAKSFANCLKAGGGGLATNQVMIGGRPFTHYRLQDADMSHFLQADADRSRYQGRCYAIDLIINGTNPQVYDPPATPPFSREQAQAALHQLLLRIGWLTPAEDGR